MDFRLIGNMCTIPEKCFGDVRPSVFTTFTKVNFQMKLSIAVITTFAAIRRDVIITFITV